MSDWSVHSVVVCSLGQDSVDECRYVCCMLSPVDSTGVVEDKQNSHAEFPLTVLRFSPCMLRLIARVEFHYHIWYSIGER